MKLFGLLQSSETGVSAIVDAALAPPVSINILQTSRAYIVSSLCESVNYKSSKHVASTSYDLNFGAFCKNLNL